MSALEQAGNGKTGRENMAENRRKLPHLIKMLLPLSVENIAFSRNVLGKLPLKLSIAYRTGGNPFAAAWRPA